MNYSSCSASISVCMQHIVNLSINTLQLMKYKAIERLRYLLEYNDSRDAHLNFQNGGNASR